MVGEGNGHLDMNSILDDQHLLIWKGIFHHYISLFSFILGNTFLKPWEYSFNLVS